MKALLKPKPEKRDIIALSVTESTKREYHQLVKLADQLGFDLTGAFSERITDLITQAKQQLQEHTKHRATINGELVSKV